MSPTVDALNMPAEESLNHLRQPSACEALLPSGKSEISIEPWILTHFKFSHPASRLDAVNSLSRKDPPLSQGELWDHPNLPERWDETRGSSCWYQYTTPGHILEVGGGQGHAVIYSSLGHVQDLGGVFCSTLHLLSPNTHESLTHCFISVAHSGDVSPSRLTLDTHRPVNKGSWLGCWPLTHIRA